MKYSYEDILKTLIAHFTALNYTCKEYTNILGDVRIPLFCVKSENDQSVDEIVIDIITEENISKAQYLPTMTIDNVTVEYASAPSFFQHYLRNARIYWAYGDDVIENRKFNIFKAACKKNGIGLLKISSAVNVVQEAKSLIQLYSAKIDKQIDEIGLPLAQHKDHISDLFKKLIEEQQEEMIHYLIYYGSPRFQRREITKRDTQDLSLILINSLLGIKRLKYSTVLSSFADNYRKADKTDYELALGTIKHLWKERFDIEYPDVQRDFESVLLLNPNYRDHFLHQFQVFLLGAVIIDRLYRTKPIRDFNRKLNVKFEDVWLAAAAYHDFNYPIQLWESWMTRFVKMFINFPGETLPLELNLEKLVIRDEFISKVQAICSAIGHNNIDDCLINFILERVALSKNHAVLSAFGIFGIFNGNDKLPAPAINHAAASILLHDEPNWTCFSGKFENSDMEEWEQNLCQQALLPQLKFESLPLAFLLTFCDSVQEWGREGRGYDTATPELLNINVDTKKIAIEIAIEDNPSFRRKLDDFEKLKQYLEDERFEVKIISRSGGQEATFLMKGQ